ncbi:hypothetical protein CHS0354_003465 [Potamilus streckersoni]|uniref:Pyruvate kinase C-terminal domain-containing protein n=1 Tax=Potamilus streckersoni TaxID=2493646 RepID=A0AAE0SNR7_9BIVA|nr:hypothetical protein CHS0354_003465 [Potamilus streckersoni]
MSEWTADVDRRIYKGIEVGFNRNFLKPGNSVVIVTGWKPGTGSTNTMRIITVQDVRLKDQLAPITGISSVPSFNVMPNEFSTVSSAGTEINEEDSVPRFF